MAEREDDEPQPKSTAPKQRSLELDHRAKDMHVITNNFIRCSAQLRYVYGKDL